VNNDWHRVAGVTGIYSSIKRLGAAAIAIVGVGLLIIGISTWVPSARMNTARCFEAFAHDQNRSVEELFRNPALQESLIEATTLCSR
jgi:hypothetical protein